MQSLLQSTAWSMKQPELYGCFHLSILLVGLTLVVVCAWKLRHISLRHHKMLLFTLAITLLLSETYKQLFHFYIMDNKQYDVWIFPFQLCSLPMYLCLFLPFMKSKTKPIETFLMDFNLLGAIMALLVPYDLMQPYITMTFDAFLWHFIIAFIGFYIGFSHYGDTRIKGFIKTLPILAICIIIAEGCNVLFHSYGDLNMFYISPYTPNIQPFFSMIANHVGIPMGNIIYILAMCLGAFCIHMGFHFYRTKVAYKNI